MPPPITIGDGGDLFVAVGQGANQKIMQVHKVILAAACPFFKTMFDPNGPWKEALKDNNVHKPLQLIEGDPDTVLNLFKIIHFKSKDVVTDAADWLQKLAVLCDFYGCCESVHDFFTLRINNPGLKGPDQVIISALLGNKNDFEKVCAKLVTTPKSRVEALCHPGLMSLLPDDILDKMVTYRREARQEYTSVIQRPIYDMHEAAKDNRLCMSFEKRQTVYTALLMAGKVLHKDVDIDQHLYDLHEVFTTRMLTSDKTSAIADLTQKCTSGRCLGCAWAATSSIKNAASKIFRGKNDGSMVLCFECFRGRKTAFAQTCELHRPKAKVEQKT